MNKVKKKRLKLFIASVIIFLLFVGISISISYARECMVMGYDGGGLDLFEPICRNNYTVTVPYEEAVRLHTGE